MLCFVVVMQSFVMNSHEVFIHIHQGCFAGTGAVVRLPQCQWSKPDGYGKISQCIPTTKHSKAKTVCIFLGIYCTSLSTNCSFANLTITKLLNALLNITSWVLASIILDTFHGDDDVIKWNHFPRYWLFVWGIHRSRWIPRTKASDAELWCFLWSASE